MNMQVPESLESDEYLRCLRSLLLLLSRLRLLLLLRRRLCFFLAPRPALRSELALLLRAMLLLQVFS